MVFSSEAEVIAIIDEALAAAGSSAGAKYYKDDQRGAGITRTVMFTAAVPISSESVVNAICDIGSRPGIDRGITYAGGKSDPTDGGEVRYLFFEAQINPFTEA